MDVLLVNPPSTEEAPSVPHEVGEPIGLCYLAASLRARGYKVYVLDGFTLGLSVRQLVDFALKFNPRIAIGVSMLETSALATASFVRQVRAGGYSGHICAGNYYASLNPERAFKLAPELDSIVRGEGEEVFADLVDHLTRKDEGWRNFQGVAYVLDERFYDNGLAPQMPIDELLEPVRDCLPQTLDAGGTANLVTGRGCYANCSFCSIATFFKPDEENVRYRVRDEKAVVEEMARLARDFGIRRFLIPDDNFMLPGKHRAPRVHRFCDEIEKANLKVEFTITCRADDIFDDLIARLKSVGLVGVYIGIESFLPRRLKLFHKGLKPETNFHAFDVLDRHGLFCKMGFIMYDPHSQLDEIAHELGIMRERLECEQVIHTSIDNIVRHSTYPLELQAGTAVQRQMTGRGRTFESGAGYDYFFDDERSYALSRFAAALLRYEGETFAVLRSLSYRLCFGNPLEGDLHEVTDRACTDLWKRFGRGHFETYLAAADLFSQQPPDVSSLEALIRAHAVRLESLRQEALATIKSANIEDIERPWVRFVELDAGNEEGPVYDPASDVWLTLTGTERAALRNWSRVPLKAISAELAQQFGKEAAEVTVESLEKLVAVGHFVGTREVEAPLQADDFIILAQQIVADLVAGRVGPRDVDFKSHHKTTPAWAETTTSRRSLLVIPGNS
jgi:anaerobic magnesium-protoporphyrin IX monomethyl ester cyclase